MEAAASLPLPASRFLSPPPHPTPAAAAAAACCSRRNISCARAAPRALEAPQASRPPPRPSPRRSAVAEVKAAPDPVAALTRCAAHYMLLRSSIGAFYIFVFVVVIRANWIYRNVDSEGGTRETEVLG